MGQEIERVWQMTHDRASRDDGVAPLDVRQVQSGIVARWNKLRASAEDLVKEIDRVLEVDASIGPDAAHTANLGHDREIAVVAGEIQQRTTVKLHRDLKHESVVHAPEARIGIVDPAPFLHRQPPPIEQQRRIHHIDVIHPAICSPGLDVIGDDERLITQNGTGTVDLCWRQVTPKVHLGVSHMSEPLAWVSAIAKCTSTYLFAGQEKSYFASCQIPVDIPLGNSWREADLRLSQAMEDIVGRGLCFDRKGSSDACELDETSQGRDCGHGNRVRPERRTDLGCGRNGIDHGRQQSDQNLLDGSEEAVSTSLRG